MGVVELAGCLIEDREEKYLLIHRNFQDIQQWEIPGGKVHAGETAEQAAIREVNEELAVAVVPLELLTLNEFDENDIQYQYSVFLCNAAGSSFQINEPEKFDSFQFFSIKEMQQIRSNLSVNAGLMVDFFLKTKHENTI